MERHRESRRGTAAVSSSFSSSRRRSRGSVFRETSGACEVEDGGNNSLRDRSKKERPSRRRRLSSNENYHVDRDEVEDGSSDESLDEDHEDEDEPARGGGSGGNLSLRRATRGKPQWKGSDEVIGVSVPRKARSVSAKRLQDSIPAVRPSSSSSPARTATSVSPPSSNASMKADKRAKPVIAKAKPPKTSKVSISESEVEVAQFLYGLTRQAKPESVQSLSLKLDFKQNPSNEGSVSVASKASSPVSTPISLPSSSHSMVLPQHSSSTHALTILAPKRKKPRVVQLESSGNPAIMVPCSESPLPGNSISHVPANHAMKVEADKGYQDLKAEIMSPKSDNNIEPNNSGSSKAESSIPKDILQSEEKSSPPFNTKKKIRSPSNPGMSEESMLHIVAALDREENRARDTGSQSSMDQNHQITQKELSSSTQKDIPQSEEKLSPPFKTKKKIRSPSNLGMSEESMLHILVGLDTEENRVRDAGSQPSMNENHQISPKGLSSYTQKDIPESEEKLSPPIKTKKKIQSPSNPGMSRESMVHILDGLDTEENRARDANIQSSIDQNHQIIQKELSSSTQKDIPQSVEKPNLPFRAKKKIRSPLNPDMSRESTLHILAGLDTEENRARNAGNQSSMDQNHQTTQNELISSTQKDIPLSEEKPNPPFKTKKKIRSSSNPTMSRESTSHVLASLDTEENRARDADGQSSMDQNHQITQKDLSSSTQDLPSLSTADVKLEDSKMPSLASAMAKGVKGPKFEIDLMAPPENCYPDEYMPDATDRSADHKPSPVIDEIAMKNKGISNLPEKDREEVRLKQDCSTLGLEEKVHRKEAAEEKQSVNDKKTKSGHDESPLDKAGNKQHSQKISKSTARQTERTVPPIGIMTSTSTPIPVPIPGWPGGLPPFGYLGSSPANLSGLSSLQGAKPVEGNSAIPNLPSVMLPHPQPKRCATHLFIAHLIYYQQQLARLHPFWHAAGPAAPYVSRPYNMNILPLSDAFLLGSSAIRNPNLSANSNLVSGSSVTSNNHNLKEKAPNAHADAQRKQHIPTQTAQQGAAFMFPFTQPRTGETKSSTSADNSGLLCGPAASAAAASASMNAKFSNIAAASDPPYMTMLPGNYPFPIPPSYRASPFFGGSFFPPQVMQLQPHPTTSTGSLSSQKHLQAQQCLPASMPMPESLRTEPESAGNSKLHAHNFSGHSALPANFPPNFPIMATALGGKQQPPNDQGLQMSLKAIELSRPLPPGHAMLQTMHDVGHNHYQLGHHLQIQTANLSKAPAKAAASAKGSDKSSESIHPQSTALAVQQLQKQALAQTKPPIPALSTTSTTGGTYPDRIPAVYSGAGSNLLAVGSMGFPTMQMQCPPQWKMPSSQRVVQAGPSANAMVQPAVAVAVPPTPSAGSPSGKVTTLPSSPVNSSRRAIHSGSPVLAQSAQVQTLGKAQQFFSNSEPVHQVSGTSLSQKRHGELNLAMQPMFPGSLNMKRPTNQQTQQGSPVLSAAGSSGFLAGGGGKGPTVYSPLGGSSVTVMTGPSYVKSAANLPVKSAEQKPATA